MDEKARFSLLLWTLVCQFHYYNTSPCGSSKALYANEVTFLKYRHFRQAHEWDDSRGKLGMNGIHVLVKLAVLQRVKLDDEDVAVILHQLLVLV